MNEINKQNLDSIIKTINRNIITSFLITLLFFIIIVTIAFVNYKNNEKKGISQKLNATFLAFIDNLSQELTDIATSVEFKDYLHSGKISREHHYSYLANKILNKTHESHLHSLAGIEIFNSSGNNIFSYGTKTKDSVTLDLCYLNRRLLNFEVGNCTYSWTLYFQKDIMIAELKKLNPDLMYCDNCTQKIITGKYFGAFPIAKFTNMQVDLKIKKHPATLLWEIVYFITGMLSILVIWNVNRIKSVFKQYLSDPIIDITAKIKENKPLPQMEVEELTYLTKQIDQWKKQVVELEKIKTQEKTTEEKTKTMQSIGASIAHELRTPIRSIISGVSGIEKFLPILLESYDLAKQANLQTKNIRPHQIELLHKVLSNLKIEGASANTIIDMLLMKIRGTIAETSVVNKLSISECVTEALQRYVFQTAEKDLIICDTTDDFQFVGDKILVVHILFNLLKNALYYIARAQKGKIYIYCKNYPNENLLCFKDTGKGIAQEVLPHIFDRFYSKTEGGVGIGLSFCKMAMEWMGGSISCQSIEEEYAEFILHFPISNSNMS